MLIHRDIALGRKPIYLAINGETGGKYAWWNPKNVLQDVFCVRSTQCTITYFLGAAYRRYPYTTGRRVPQEWASHLQPNYIYDIIAVPYGDTNGPIRCTWLIAVSYTGSLFNFIHISCRFLSSRSRNNVAHYRCGAVGLRSEKPQLSHRIKTV